ncbi:hypothetical protein C8R43DRAFT_43540 [Mycena crocata]|nr:hypothetical protein C8R43DRAFT_43540 [Mycena crocata]
MSTASISSNPESPMLLPADATTIDDHLKILRQSLKVQVPYTGGIHTVKGEDLVLFYEGENAVNRRVDFSNATAEDLENLAQACQRATFGVSQEAVLDETYRKAGKLELGKFAACLDVVASGILDAITPDLLQGQSVDGEKTIRAKMYKLNVYGPGSFFKAHKDTPRGETMIGSLVITFPSAHSGGALTLEHGGTSWTFDSAAELTKAPGAAVAYVAFYSDVTHAVEPVLTGHRATLTYNLFLVDRSAGGSIPAPTQRAVPGPERTHEDALQALLRDPSFLPRGGLLAYGLAHQYPMPAPPKSTWDSVSRRYIAPPSRLGPVLQLLKGADARIRTVSTRAGLVTHVKILYDSAAHDKYGSVSGQDVLAADVLDTSDVYAEGDSVLRDEIEMKGEMILARAPERAAELSKKRKRTYEYYDEEEEERQKKLAREAVPVHWVTRITDLNRVGSHYMAYGNDPSIEYAYGNAALFVAVPVFGEGVRAPFYLK